MHRVKFTAFSPLVPASDSLMILLAAVSLVMLLFRWNSNARSLFCFSRSKIKTVERNFKVLISAIKWGTHNPINQPEFQQNRLKQNFNFYKPIRRGKEMVNLKKIEREREKKTATTTTERKACETTDQQYYTQTKTISMQTVLSYQLLHQYLSRPRRLH